MSLYNRVHWKWNTLHWLGELVTLDVKMFIFFLEVKYGLLFA